MPPEREYTKRYTEPVPACSTCFPKRLGYPEWAAWSIANNVAGQYQRVCPECGLYRWPEEFVKPQQAAAVFTDGGCIQSNPSPHGGTWAFVHVNAEGEVIRKDCGVVIPGDAGLPSIENNLMEFIAIINALRILPDGWTGHVFTDNQNALRRMNDPYKAKMGGVPAVFVELARHVRGRLGSLNFTLLGGHPTRAELKQGQRRDGKPVSVHNAACDAMCREAAAKFMAAKGGDHGWAEEVVIIGGVKVTRRTGHDPREMRRMGGYKPRKAVGGDAGNSWDNAVKAIEDAGGES